MLIGPDNYYNFIYVTVITGKSNDPITLELTLGWIIYGLYSMDNKANVYYVDSHFYLCHQAYSTRIY